MITPCCIFSYREDSDDAVLSARSALLAGLFPVFVVEEVARPISPDCREELENDGVIIVSTDFPRGQNLRGIDCVSGMLQVYDRILKKTGASHLVKLDSDTILNGSKFIRLAVQKDYRLFGWGSPEHQFHGNAYVISKRHVTDLLGFISKWKGLPGFDNRSVPEDLSIFHMAIIMESTEVGISQYDVDGGFGSFWCFQPKSTHFPVFAKKFESVSFGNRKDQSGVNVSRVESHRHMREFLEHIQSCQIPSSCGSLLAV